MPPITTEVEEFILRMRENGAVQVTVDDVATVTWATEPFVDDYADDRKEETADEILGLEEVR